MTKANTQDLTAESSRARFERLKGELLNVTGPQRKALFALLGVDPDPDTLDVEKSIVGQPNVPLLYDAVCVVLQAAIPTFRAGPLSVMRGLRIDLNRAANTLDGVFEGNTSSQPLQRTERYALYLFCLRLVLQHMRSASIPLTTRTLVQQCAHVAIIIDDAFPGYASSGLLRIVFDRAAKGGGAGVGAGR